MEGFRLPDMRSKKELAIGGFRDFYPELYQKINYILKIFRAVPRLYGYLEYETPTVEPLKLYQLKSGEELVEETFKVTDRKDRDLVLRPEITPSLARMLAARQQFYSRPIRWFCVSRVFRDETPQRGRVKEHWQLNVDILGIEDVAADAEIIDILVMIIKSIGFTSSDFVIRINDRRFVQSYIESLGLMNYLEVIRVLDRRDKLLQEELEGQLRNLNYSTEKATEIALILRRIAAGNQDTEIELPKRKEVRKLSKNLSQIQTEATLKALQAANVPKLQAKKLSEFASIRGPPAEFLQTIDSLSL